MSDLVMARETGHLWSNAVYPVAWSQSAQWTPSNLPPPIHNVPSLHLARILDLVLQDEYWSWVTANTLLALATSFVILLSISRCAGYLAASVSATAYLLLPQTIWFNLNPLAEQVIVFAASLLVYGGVRYERKPRLGAAWIAVGSILLVGTRSSFILILPTAILFFLIFTPNLRSRYRVALGYVGVSLIGMVLAGLLMPTHPTRGFGAILQAGANPARRMVGNMEAYFPGSDDVILSHQASKILTNTWNALVPNTSQEIVFESALLIITVVAIFACRGIRVMHTTVYWAASLVAIYLVTSLVFQTQSRYLAPVLPATVTLSAAAVYRAQRFVPTSTHLRRAGLVGCVLVFMALSVGVSERYRSQAVSETALVDVLRESFDVPAGESVVALDLETTSEQQLAYALGPTPVVNMRRYSADVCMESEIASRWRVALVVTTAGATREEVLGGFCEPAALQGLDVVASNLSTATESLDVWALTP